MKEDKQAPEREQPAERPALPMLNEARVAGRLTNAVKTKDYGEGKMRAQFSIAVPRGGRRKEGQPDADFIAITAWGDLVAQCTGLDKGDAVEVQGRLRTWKDETDRYHWGITADTVQVHYRQAAKARADKRQQEPAGAR